MKLSELSDIVEDYIADIRVKLGLCTHFLFHFEREVQIYIEVS